MANDNHKFAAKVAEEIQKDKGKLDVLVKQSILDLINDAQLSVGKGGRMRVDTGFLRASGQLSLSGMPSGPTRPAKGAKPNSYKPPSYVAKIAGVRSDSNVFFGWSAGYAAARESKDGFLEGALQKWQQIVDKNAARLNDE